MPNEVPGAGQFSCLAVACNVGQICIKGQWKGYATSCFSPGDACADPPAACVADLTCACLAANGYSGSMWGACTTDSAGDVSIVAFM
jgi:hypothetical protein